MKPARLTFYSGLLLKLALGSLFASFLLSDWFVPFVRYFVESGFSDPYAHFEREGLSQAFPYPALMLYLLAVPRVLLGWVSDSAHWSLFLSRLPVLASDLGIFFILRRWVPSSPRPLLWLYWFSPVLIYISYVHGQLDAIPIALLFGSLYFLFKERWLYSALMLGLSLSTKTHIAITLPFFLLYLLSKGRGLRGSGAFFLVIFGVFVGLNLPYLSDPSFLKMVFLNREQSKVFSLFLPFSGLSLYLLPLGLLMLFVRGALISRYNQAIFLMFLGFAFNALLLFIPPSPGWYYWLIPFLSYFCLLSGGRLSWLFWGVQGLYLLYFLLIPDSDVFKVWHVLRPSVSELPTPHQLLSEMGLPSDMFVNLVFTALQGSLLISCVLIYRRGLETYRRHKITSSPFFIGIGGDSGVGKSELSCAIEGVFSPQNALILRGDDMHRWGRGHEKWTELTHLHPKANELHREVHYLKALKAGKKALRRHYDHDTGQFTEAIALEARPVVIFEGLHPFFLEAQRRLYDLKIFIRPQKALQQHWKIVRDTQSRAYSKEAVLAQLAKREKDAAEYIDPQALWADILVEPRAVNEIACVGDAREAVEVSYDLRLPNSAFLDPILSSLEAVSTFKIEHEYDKAEAQTLRLSGAISSEEIGAIAECQIPGLFEIGVATPKWPEGAYGVLVLIVVYLIFERADEGE